MLSCRRAFTLVEMLVVIGIIAILGAILFPVFSSARIKARQTACIGNLQQLLTALKQYYEDYRAYPPAPIWDNNSQRFYGGFSALWPDYITSQETLICPDDLAAKTRLGQAKQMVYSSYNANIDFKDNSTWCESTPWPDPSAAVPGQFYLRQRLYNRYGYDQNGYDVYHEFDYIGPEHGNSLPSWLGNYNLSWRQYPRLMNRYAPDFTIVTHCPFHRRHFSQGAQRDVIIRLGGEAKVMHLSDMAAVGNDGATPWQRQHM
ncbi:MAG: type II secretion system protein [Armatimonadetes bacterium]|nr:type II secretion system protein [Armatimonadota bacterium]